jgi:hypothetical protein
MKLLKIASLSFLALCFILTSCKKEDDTAQSECRILKTESYSGNNVAFKGSYIYTDNRITKVEVPEIGGYYTLEYTGDRITKRKYYENGITTHDMYDLISYNTDGTISKIESFDRVSGTTYERYAISSFSYTNGKLSKLQLFEDWGGSTDLIEEYTYTLTGNNITSLTYKDMESLQTGTITFQYNSEMNPYHTQNSQMLLIDPFLSSIDGMFPFVAGDLLPLVLSANSMTSVREDNTTPIKIEYTKDEKGNVTSLLMDGEKVYSYAFECQ